MILAGTVKKMLSKVPDDAEMWAYEGEDTGINISMPDGTAQWIVARDTDEEDEQTGFSL